LSDEALCRKSLECLARFLRTRRASLHFSAVFIIYGICLILWTSHIEASATDSRFTVTQEVAQLIRYGQQAMYNCDFDSAERNFDELIRLYPNHPTGFMYRAACIWWRCILDRTNKEMQARFLQFTKDGIARGDALVNKDPKDFYAQMFLAGIYGNQTRFYVTITHSYWSAMHSGLDRKSVV
jgi:hypothetical protein